jgi:hypothetical protein
MRHFIAVITDQSGKAIDVQKITADIRAAAVHVLPYHFDSEFQAVAYRQQVALQNGLTIAPPAHGKRKPVKCWQTGEIFPSASAAARAYGVTTSAMTKHLRQPFVNRTVRNYTFEYVTDLT